MAWLCSRREYCSRGVLDLLRRKDVTGEEAAAVLERLRSERYVDDARYARAFARDKAALSGWGPRKIAFALSAKGIAPGVSRPPRPSNGVRRSCASLFPADMIMRG